MAEKLSTKAELLEVELNPFQYYIVNSKVMKITPNKDYVASTIVAGIRGEPRSAYFGVDILGKKNKDLDRRIFWLDDFSGEEKTINIRFNSPTDSVRFVYRMNYETKKSNCKFRILPVEKVSLTEFNGNVKGSTEGLKLFYPKINSLTDEQELILEKNLVWIYGSSRSGTTWFGTKLLSHNTHSIDEPMLGRHLGLGEVLMGKDVSLMEVSAKRPSYFFSSAFKNTWKFFLRKLILNRIYHEFQDLSKKIIIKEPSAGSLGFSTIEECLPDSKIIFLLRDGRDVLDSQLDANLHGFEKGGRFHTLIKKPLESHQRILFIENRAKTWVKLMDIFMNTFHNHREELRILVRYENLKKDTKIELRKIYNFLGIEISQEELENKIKKFSFENIPAESKGEGKRNRIAKPGKWKDNMRKEEIELMEKIMGSTLKRLGYE